MMQTDRVLMIDDEENLLRGVKRHLRGRFDIETATSGSQALSLLDPDRPFAVVVCDMRMPGMSGATTLGAFHAKSPQTTRIMLTGNADQQTAIEAINAGHIFRFLNKPCSPDDLARGIDDGIQQFKLLTAERHLLETTMAGSVKLLSEVASLSDPGGASHTHAMRDWAKILGPSLDIPSRWELDFAVLLAPLGRLAVPQETLVRQGEGRQLRPEEAASIAASPEVGRSLIVNIPRMGAVAEAVLYQDKRYDGGGFPEGSPGGTAIPILGRIVHLLKALAKETNGMKPSVSAFDALAKDAGRFDPDLLATARQSLAPATNQTSNEVQESGEHCPLYLVRPGARLLSDIFYQKGGLVLAKGCVMSETLIAKLRGLNKVHPINEPVHVAYGTA